VRKQWIGELTLFKKNLGKNLMGQAFCRSKVYRSLQQRDRLVQFALPQINDAEVVFGNIVTCGYCKGVVKQCFAVTPISGLEPGGPAQNANDEYCSSAKN